MEKQLYSLQGIIFQESISFDIAYKTGLGSAAIITHAMKYSMFHGLVNSSEVNGNIYIGEVTDRWGDSKITEFIMNENGVSFTKKYKGRPPIRYIFFECKENIWYGKYVGLDSGKGTAKLIVIPIPESFFVPVDDE